MVVLDHGIFKKGRDINLQLQYEILPLETLIFPIVYQILTEEDRRIRLGVLDSLELGVLAPLCGPSTASSQALLS